MRNQLTLRRRLINMSVTLTVGCCFFIIIGAAFTQPTFDVLTYHNDPANTGVNTSETILTPGNVNAHTFGKLFSIPTDGEVFTQPLVKTHVRIKVGPNQGFHDVVYFGSENDTLYAVDAESGATLWQDSFIDPEHGITPVPWQEIASDRNIAPVMGITGTPVIDPKLGTLFVSAMTKEVENGNVHYRQRLHAIDITTGEERLGSPVLYGDTEYNNGQTTYITGPSVAGTGDGSINGVVTFNAMHANQRESLALLNGIIYVGFSSQDDIGPYHGWILGFRESDLSLTAAFNDTPNGGLGGIWGAAAKPAIDSAGFLYVSTGNGSFDPTLDSNGFPANGDYGNAIIKLAVDPTTTPQKPGPNGWGLKVVDYFVPADYQYQNDRDGDIGSGGVTLLPDDMGSSDHQHLLITGGKDSRLYLLDRDNFGKFHADHDAIVSEVSGASHRLFTCPVPFDGLVYVATDTYNMQAFSVNNAVLSPKAISYSAQIFGFPGATAAISSNGTKTPVLWALDRDSNALVAFDLYDFPIVTYTSNDDADDVLGNAVRFTVPTVANGRVYAGTEHSLVCYGLLPTVRTGLQQATPQVSTIGPVTPNNANGVVKPGEIDLTWTNNATNATNYVILRKTGTAGTYITLAILPANAVSYVDTNHIEPHTDYEYHILAVNAAGNSDFAGFFAHAP